MTSTWNKPWIQLDTSLQTEWFSSSWLLQWPHSHPWAPHHHGIKDSRPCICRDVGHTLPSDWLAQSTYLWSQQLSTAHDRLSLLRSLEHKWPEGSEYEGMAPSWSKWNNKKDVINITKTNRNHIHYVLEAGMSRFKYTLPEILSSQHSRHHQNGAMQ